MDLGQAMAELKLDDIEEEIKRINEDLKNVYTMKETAANKLITIFQDVLQPKGEKSPEEMQNEIEKCCKEIHEASSRARKLFHLQETEILKLMGKSSKNDR